ncbi:MAG: hypothetical protein R6V20_02225 [Desulfobia sp.]
MDLICFFDGNCIRQYLHADHGSGRSGHYCTAETFYPGNVTILGNELNPDILLQNATASQNKKIASPFSGLIYLV